MKDEKGTEAIIAVSRRDLCFYGVSGGLLLAAGLGSRAALASQPSPTVDTQYGRVRGGVRDGVAMFKGIPYGASTAGVNRFLPPKPPAAWTGVRDALRFGSPCPQINEYEAWWRDPQPGSENCLVLNVFTSNLATGARPLPVMVWFHGGAFENESAGEPGFDTPALAKTGNVVLVTLNHRLNIFGYLYLGQSADDRFATSGNVGQLDLIAALKWVRDNIANFGGDPGNVTIFGESGGGAKVGTTIAMPHARGLFHKAIIQSGSFVRAAKVEDAARIADMAYRFLGIKAGDVAALQRVPTGQMLKAYNHIIEHRSHRSSRQGLTFEPVVDGHSLLFDPWSDKASEAAAEIPMIIGTTVEEMAGFVPQFLQQPITNDAELIEKLRKVAFLTDVPEDRYPELVKLYRREMPALSGTQLLVRIATDIGFWRNALQQAEQKIAVGGPPVFMYEFGWAIPFAGNSWAIHGIDLPFTFGAVDYPRAWGPEDSQAVRAAADPRGDRYRLAEQTMKAWGAFAHCGDPSTPTLKWPAYTPEARATMRLDRHSQVVHDPRSFARSALGGG